MALSRSAWSGWAIFAGTLLALIGVANFIYGLFAVVENEVLVDAEDGLIVLDLTGWGLLMMAFGVVQLLVAFGLFAGNSVARVVAIVIAGLHLVQQIATLSAYPVWSVLMVALDVMVIYALTVHWGDIRSYLRDDLDSGVSAPR